MGEEVKKEVATMGEDVKKVANEVDMIEEEVCATKNLLEETNSRVVRVEGAKQECAQKPNMCRSCNKWCLNRIDRKNDEKEKTIKKSWRE